MAEFELDCKGLSCPMPIVKISKQVKQMGVGDTLKVFCKDNAFKPDVEAWSRKTGNKIIEFEATDDFFVVHIEKTKE